MSDAVKKLWPSDRWQFGVIAAVVIALAAITGATLAVITSQDAATRVTKIEQTPCAKDPASKGCEKLRIEVEQSATTQITCIPFRRAGYECPKPGSPLAKGGDSSGGNTPSSLAGPAEAGPSGNSGSEVPSEPPVSESANPPVNVAPVLEGVTETVCSVNALGLKVCN